MAQAYPEHAALLLPEHEDCEDEHGQIFQRNHARLQRHVFLLLPKLGQPVLLLGLRPSEHEERFREVQRETEMFRAHQLFE